MKDISVVLLTYNSSLEKTLFSLRSIIKQKDVSFDVVVADDGSKNNNFDEIEQFFIKNNFKDYTLISHKNNFGTIKNFISAIEKVKTNYFKDFGQGDAFFDEYSLKKIYDACIKYEPTILFTDYVCFNKKSGLFNVFKNYRYPQNTDIYTKGDLDRIKIRQLAYDDIILGASFVYKTDKSLDYLHMIENTVKYAEDNTVRLMALYREKIIYLPEKTIMYESGEGISTSNNSEFEELLDLDWNNTNDLILDYCRKNNNKSNNQIISHIEYERNSEHSFFDKVEYYIKNKGFLKYRLLLENIPKKTGDQYDKKFMENCLKND